MSKTLRTVQAGRYVRMAVSTKVKAKDSPKCRAEKQKATSRAQAAINTKMSTTALASIIAENFLDSPTALWVTLTFDEDHYPNFERRSEYWSFCCREATNYLARLRRLSRARKLELLSLFAPGTEEDGRYHIHMLLDQSRTDDIRDAWGKGNVDYHYLTGDPHYFTDKGWASKKSKNINPVCIAVYLSHNAKDRPVGKHPWHASKNCKRPKPDKPKTVHDDYSFPVPDGAEILDNLKISTLFGDYEYIEYLLPPRKRKQRKPRPSGRGRPKPSAG